MKYLDFQSDLIGMIVRYRSSIPVNFKFRTKLDFETCRERLLSLRTPVERPTGVGYAQTKIYLEQLDNEDSNEINFRLAGGVNFYYGGWSEYVMTLNGQLHRQDDNKALVTSGELVFAKSFVSGYTLVFTVHVVLPNLGLLWCIFADLNFLLYLPCLVLWMAFSTASNAFNQRWMVNCKEQLIALVYEALTDDAPILSKPPLYET